MAFWDLIKKIFQKQSSKPDNEKPKVSTETTETGKSSVVTVSYDELFSKPRNPVNYTVTSESPKCHHTTTERIRPKSQKSVLSIDTRFIYNDTVKVTNLGEERLDFSKFKGKLGYIPKK